MALRSQRFRLTCSQGALLLLPVAAQFGLSGLGDAGGATPGAGTAGLSALTGIGALTGATAGAASPLSGSALGNLGAFTGSTPGSSAAALEGGTLGSLGALGTGAAGTGNGLQVPATLNRAFHYADIAKHLLDSPTALPVDRCKELCVGNSSCAAWEVCTPLGDGCEGCYLVKTAPRRFTERPGWHAEIVEGRETQDEPLPEAENMTYEECHTYLLDANGADQSQPFHEPENMKRYTECGFKLRNSEKSRQLFVQGKHYPTFLMTNFAEPSPELPQEVEQEMFASSRRPQRPRPPQDSPGITNQLHSQIGTTSWEDHLRGRPIGPHAFLLPFYDTNIGHWMKQHGSMNPLQSYEMQSLLQEGDVVADVGANLGCYTVPLAERVGPTGKVLAFEPFRLLHQITSANVAMNGVGNAWVFPVGLSTEFKRLEARPPQLRFFSSPGGVKLQNQQDGLKQEEQLQLYDWDSAPEVITVVTLDELMLQSERASILGFPVVQDLRLIKIDVEGMEKEVIMGAQQTIKHFKPIIWTENVAYFSSNGQDTSLLYLMEQLEYGCAGAQNAPNDVICTDKHGRGHQVMI